MSEYKEAEFVPGQGATVNRDGSVTFRIWGPRCQTVEVVDQNGERRIPLQLQEEMWQLTTEQYSVGDSYCFKLDNEKQRPDPAGRAFPGSVHECCRIVDPSVWEWHDSDWQGIEQHRAVIYELHPGTFTPEGTLDSAIGKLDYLVELGISCVELMPVAQFPGTRNWGYDGVGIYAVQNSYGGPEALQRFVDACHTRNLAVCLDVVYNHLGPEGNYLHDYGPYFTDRYQTPWGMALNYDGADSEPVRRFIIDNALWWISAYHIDMLRLDAVHSIFDFGALHILEQLQMEVQQLADNLGRRVQVIAESDLNDPRLLLGRERGGYQLDGQWSDDFHHALHALLSGEQNGYYCDFGGIGELAKALQRGFVYNGSYSAFRRRRHGGSTAGTRPQQFVVCLQNHDQVGNRAIGDRLTSHLTPAQQRLAAFALLLNPCQPLLFMGQEYGEVAPFEYFIDHGDEELLEAVRNGRRREFSGFDWQDVPDPALPAALERSRLDWTLTQKSGHRELLELYKALLRLRAEEELFAGKRCTGWQDVTVEYSEEERVVVLNYNGDTGPAATLVLSFSGRVRSFPLGVAAAGTRQPRYSLCSEEVRFGGGIKQLPLPDQQGCITLPPNSGLFLRWGAEQSLLKNDTQSEAKQL